MVAEEADQAGAPSAEDDFAETLQLSDEQGAEGADGAGYDSSSGSGEVYDSGSGEEDSEGEDDDDAELLEDSDVEGTSDAEEAGATAGSASAERGGEESDPYMRGLKRGKDGQLYIVDEEEFEAARKEQAQKTLPVDPVRTMLLNADDVSSDEEVSGASRCGWVYCRLCSHRVLRLCVRRRAATPSATCRCGGTGTRSTWGTT